jgi:hypothetical protein
MNGDRDETNEGASRQKLARRQGGAARVGLDREEAADTLSARKQSGGAATRGHRASARRNARGRVGGEQVARSGHTAGDRTGVVAALGRGRTQEASGRTRTPRVTGASARTGGGRARVMGKPGQRTRSRARKAGKKK